MPTGMTLVEMLVAITILGIVFSLGAVSIPIPVTAQVDPAVDSLRSARRRALKSGLPVTVVIPSPQGTLVATANPDGTVLVDPVIKIDFLTGRIRETR